MKDIKTERHKAIMELIATDPGAVADMLIAWETELSTVMPADYKDWWQNSKEEWPMVARMSIEGLRKREQLAWDMLEEERNLHDLGRRGFWRSGCVSSAAGEQGVAE